MQAFAIVLSFAVSAVAIVLTTIAVRRMLGVLRAGKPTEGRTGNPGARLATMLNLTS